MIAFYAVGSLKFKTQAGLIRALEREGAKDARFTDWHTLVVEWPVGEVTYKADAEGRFEEQLRWDFYADRRVA